jgi:hypothetical protein
VIETLTTERGYLWGLIVHQRRYRPSDSVYLATNFVLLWPLKFELGRQIFGVGGQLVTKIKIPL